MSIQIIYWTGTGNTEAMAQAVAEGVALAGAEAKLLPVAEANKDDALAADALALGCPSMGDEVLEESEMEPFAEAIEDSLSGKKVALFGSYGWGDGAWMRDWQARFAAKGAIIVNDEGLIAQDKPGDAELAACRALGKALAE